MKKFPFFLQNASDAGNMAVSDGTIYEFGDFRLVPDDNLLLRGDDAIPLTPKAFSTLALLIERHGHLVRKEELIERIWADSFVEESAVSRCIWTIRHALGEDSKDQRFIQTVPKRGYKFIAEVTERETSVATNGNGDAVTYAPPAVPASRRLIAVAGLAVAAILGLAVWYMVSFAPAAVATGAPSSMAVLPLKPIDSQNRSEIHEIGVADSLINRLNSTKGLIVRPLSAVRSYDAIDQDPLAAGREQKVEYVLASNYQLADGKIRITAQLMDVASGGVQETFKVETPSTDIFALQDVVADEIASKLLARFASHSAATPSKRWTDNEEAYRLYLQGRNLALRRSPKAIPYLEQAISLDPDFALAYAQLARIYPKSDQGNDVQAQRVKELTDKALELDPGLSEAYVARAEWVLAREWDFTAVARDIGKALELDPNNHAAHWLNGLLLADRGQLEEGLQELDTARSIDPGAVLYMFHRGRILYYARRYEEAKTQFQQAIDLDDRFIQPYGWSVRLYETNGDYETAFQYFLKREERSPRKDQIDTYRRVYENAGWMGVRLAIADTEPASFDIARLNALLGQKDTAFEYLNRSFERRDWLMTTLKVEPAFDNLRDDPRFDQMLARVGLK